jgi:hypothetical protein
MTTNGHCSTFCCIKRSEIQATGHISRPPKIEETHKRNYFQNESFLQEKESGAADQFLENLENETLRGFIDGWT